jgi:hypothetical protein
LAPHKSKRIVVQINPAIEHDIALPITAWQSDNFAEDWYHDALGEARSGSDHNARRREVIFAVSFAESFIFEWARRKLQIEEVNEYFPSKRRFKNDSRYRRSLVEKWRMIPTELYEAGKLTVCPALDLSALEQLLRYRHGLIHAASSRPSTQNQSPESKPFPRKKDLNDLAPGWAVNIVFNLVSQLCEQLNESKPPYLESV